MPRSIALIALSLLLSRVAPVGAQVIGDPPADFPPGPFTDGGQYKVGDFKDKVLVLYFFEANPKCKECRTIIPQRAAVVNAFRGMPVKFLAVGANITLPQAAAFQSQTGLPMPIFPDSLGLMQARYGFQISLQNIWQMRVYGPNGLEAADMDKVTIERVLKKTGVHNKYDGADYDKKLRPALDLLEYGHYSAGLKALAPLSKSTSKALSGGAKKLIAEIKEEAVKWKVEGDDAATIEPLKAYDLYQKIAAAMPADELGKSASATARKLATDKTIAPELAARKSFATLTQMIGQTTVGGRGSIAAECKNIMKKYPGTPTAGRADDLYKELTGKEVGGKNAK
jgi:hypothetical protein